MVTAHFYEEETVAAQLLYALSVDDSTTAHQAATELVGTPLLFKVLSLAYYLGPPDHPLAAARAAAFVAQDPHALFSTLVSSPWPLPSYNIVKPDPKSMSEMKRALKKRNMPVLYAAALAASPQQLLELGVHPLFIQEMQVTIFKPLEHRILAHALAALAAFPSLAPPSDAWATAPQGSCAGRTFTVQTEALVLWQVQRPPPHALRGDPAKLIPAIMWETEEHEIAFYEKHFPDDIPDEWSDEEIAKSHGPSVPAGAVNPWRIAFLDCLD
jgi:hypothetical protein